MTIQYFATLRNITTTKTETCNLHFETLSELLVHLCNKYGKQFSKWVSCEDGGFGSLSIFLINGQDSRSLDGLNTRLQPEDTISIFPPVAGG